MQVDHGTVHLLNQTLFEHNSAPDGGGSSIWLSASGVLEYTLPVPLGRWLLISSGSTFKLNPGAVDSVEGFPYACPAGSVGGTSERDQSRQECAGPW